MQPISCYGNNNEDIYFATLLAQHHASESYAQFLTHQEEENTINASINKEKD
jgi:hypothetical protein